LWGAAWLQKATKNIKYLNYIKINGQILGAAEYDNTFGWDNKHAGARILLTKVKSKFIKFCYIKSLIIFVGFFFV